MTVYVDSLHTYPNGQWCHLWADTPAELETAARALKLKPAWVQNSRGFIHYDLRPSKRLSAVKHGAVEMRLSAWLRQQRTQPGLT